MLKEFLEKKSENLEVNSSRTFRTGDYGLVAKTKVVYNPDMEITFTPVINIPAGDQVGIDFLVRGSLLDGDVFQKLITGGCKYLQMMVHHGFMFQILTVTLPPQHLIMFILMLLNFGVYFLQLTVSPLILVIMLEAQYNSLLVSL